jgi:hypothetical protein
MLALGNGARRPAPFVVAERRASCDERLRRDDERLLR